MGNWSCAANKIIEEKEIVTINNKIIPHTILEEAHIALSHYPELKDVSIEFKYKNKMKNALMQARPKIGNLFKAKKDHSYTIFISRKFLVENEEFSMANVPSEVLIGWLGHELGHVMDYREKSAIKMLGFGVKYITSHDFIKKAERTADTYAINHGLGNYIHSTKDFILNHSHFSDSYKKRKIRLYLSPEEILALVNNLEEDLVDMEDGESL